jgi:hypothetical protein
VLLEIAREERDAKRLIWANQVAHSKVALAAEHFRKEEAQAARDKMRLERDLAQKRLDKA